MENSYLIPANTKKSQLIFGFFKPIDLTILIIGCAWSILMLVIVQDVDITIMIVMMLPALVAAFLVMPVPNYHNVLQLLANIVNFYTNRRKYYWKGWCIYERFNNDTRDK